MGGKRIGTESRHGRSTNDSVTLGRIVTGDIREGSNRDDVADELYGSSEVSES